MSTPHGIRMIDVGSKPVSLRTARASARLRALPETIRRIQAQELDKGDAIATARLAGIMAAKRTSDIVPLCHPLPLDSVEVSLTFPELDCVCIEVEMEALTAVTAAALAIYDMCKSIDRGMSIEAIHLEEKAGGSSGDYQRVGGPLNR
jgi:cyclic pyranopterin monophosphate synthase